MPLESAVWQVSVLLAVAAFLGLLAQRLGQPALLGYLAAGLALGPAGFHVVRQLDLVALASEVGTVLLLFVLGLQFSWSQLVAFGTRVLRLGVGQVVLTFSVAALAAWALTESVAEAWVIGAAAAFSSTTTVGKILESNRQVDSPVGRASLGTQLVQDVAVVPFMMAVTVLGLASGRSAFLFSFSLRQRQYCESIAEARRPETVARCLEKPLALLPQGKTLDACGKLQDRLAKLPSVWKRRGVRVSIAFLLSAAHF